MTVLTWEQAMALAEAHSERYRPLIYVAIDTGMRWSELVGLRRGSVDVAPPQDPGGRAARPARRRLLGPPATEDRLGHADDHDLGVPSRRCSPTTSTASCAPEPDALVFANGAGQPLSHSSFQTHHFRKAQLAAGVSCRFHDLRHTSVALAIAEGAHPKAIQVRMGHSSITVTLDRYGHLFPELDEAIATAFDARFRALASARESQNSM